MRFKDMKQAVELLYNEWNLGKKECRATGNICAWIYLMEILEKSEEIVIYKEKGKLIGFCGYSKNDSKKYFIRKMLYKKIKERLYKSKKIKDNNALKEYNNNYNYSPKEFKNYYDGEILILIVDKNYRGKNIGKKLLLETFDRAKKAKMNKLQILTDESCNYHFYESLGLNKVYEIEVKNKEYGKLGKIENEKAYIYEKILI